MPWWKGDDQAHNNAKLLAVGLVGFGLHFKATSWCSSELTDGMVPASVLPSLSPELSPAARKSLIALMVTSGLWRDVNGDGSVYEINDYLSYNPSRDCVLAKRKAERDRLATKRGSE